MQLKRQVVSKLDKTIQHKELQSKFVFEFREQIEKMLDGSVKDLQTVSGAGVQKVLISKLHIRKFLNQTRNKIFFVRLDVAVIFIASFGVVVLMYSEIITKRWKVLIQTAL